MRDCYMEKAQAAADPVIREALGRMVRAARDAFNAKNQLTAALRDLERHPDYAKTEHARKHGGTWVTAISLAWWAHACAHAALHDAPVEEAGDWLLVDADPRRCEASRRQFIETDVSDLAARKARVKGKKRTGQLVQATA